MVAPRKTKAPTGGAVEALSKAIVKPESSALSTATEAQRLRIVAALRRRPHTSYELRCLGCYQAPARVKELRDRLGYDIRTDRVVLTDGDGYTHANCALHTLVAEPAGRAQ